MKTREERNTYQAKIQKRWYQRHKESERARSREYWRRHQDKCLKYSKEYYYATKERVRGEVLTHYGNGRCACVKCGFDDIRALSIDHIDGKGEVHRRELKNTGGIVFYRWLRRNNYPEGYQTLCMNCQFIKR